MEGFWGFGFFPACLAGFEFLVEGLGFRLRDKGLGLDLGLRKVVQGILGYPCRLDRR